MTLNSPELPALAAPVVTRTAPETPKGSQTGVRRSKVPEVVCALTPVVTNTCPPVVAVPAHARARKSGPRR